MGVAILGFVFVPKGFFPLQDIGFLSGTTQAGPDISFDEMTLKHREMERAVAADPAVAGYAHAVGPTANNSSRRAGACGSSSRSPGIAMPARAK